jgi:uncharacterized membrane protein YsdA (DUF1294 family)
MLTPGCTDCTSFCIMLITDSEAASRSHLRLRQHRLHQLLLLGGHLRQIQFVECEVVRAIAV